jgi:hypothetical protein
MKYLIIFLLIICVGCSQKVRRDFRATNKIAKLKEWGYLKTDTVWKTDTLKGFKYDTLVKFDTTHTQDTFTVIKNGIRVKTLIKWKERLVTQEIEKRDTVIRYMTQSTTVNNPGKCNFWPYIIALIVAGVVILGLIFKGK